MKIKEIFNNSRTASQLGTGKFRLSLDKEAVKTPHWQMNKVLEMLESKPRLANGLKQHVRFLFKGIEVLGSDVNSVEFVREWIKQRPKLKNELFNFAVLWAGAGTGYLEPTYIQKTNGQKVLDNIFHVPDPSIIYLNLNAKSEDEYWIMEVPFEVRQIDGQVPKHHSIHYLMGSNIFRRMVYGIALPKEKFKQLTFGWSRVGFYGNGLLTAAVDNEDIADEILKNWALMAKFRALGKKIIGFYNENGQPMDPSELEAIKNQFQELEEEDSLLVNKKFVSDSLTFAGEDNDFTTQIEYLRRDSGSSLVPNYMTPFSQDSSFATAREAKIPFQLELESEQDTLEKFLNDVILEELKKSYPWIAKDTELRLERAELYSIDEKFQIVNQLYNLRAATFNELRVAAGYESVEGGDVWGALPPLEEEAPKREQKKKKEYFKFKETPLQPTFVESIQIRNVLYESNVENIQLKEEKFNEAVKKLLG